MGLGQSGSLPERAEAEFAELLQTSTGEELDSVAQFHETDW